MEVVVKIASIYSKRGIPLDDILTAGNMGLMRAVEKYDPSFNTRFATYAAFWIKQEIQRCLGNCHRAIQIPGYVIELMARFNRARNKLMSQKQGNVTDEEACAEARISPSKFSQVKKARKIAITASGTYNEEHDHTVEVAQKETEPAFSKEEVSSVIKYINDLRPTEAKVIKWRFGINCNRLTLDEVGKRLGRSKERIRQIETTALDKLKSFLCYKDE